jgi:hypothetical protein
LQNENGNRNFFAKTETKTNKRFSAEHRLLWNFSFRFDMHGLIQQSHYMTLLSRTSKASHPKPDDHAIPSCIEGGFHDLTIFLLPNKTSDTLELRNKVVNLLEFLRLFCMIHVCSWFRRTSHRFVLAPYSVCTCFRQYLLPFLFLRFLYLFLFS